jgi:hypothetical protein
VTVLDLMCACHWLRSQALFVVLYAVHNVLHSAVSRLHPPTWVM